MEIRIDGVVTPGGTNSTDLSGVGDDLRFGIQPVNINTYPKVDFLEVLAFKSALTEQQAQGLEGYLRNKYGIK